MVNQDPAEAYPTMTEALALFDEYHVPTNIRTHCQTVSALSRVLADQLNQAGRVVDAELAELGGLFHDFLKVIRLTPLTADPYFKSNPTPEEVAMQRTLKTRFPDTHETEATYHILKHRWPKLANLIRSLHLFQPDGTYDFTSTEQQIVVYADCRCFVDEVWPLRKRCAEFLTRKEAALKAKGRYEHCLRSLQQLNQVEAQLFKDLPLTPDDLPELVNEYQERYATISKHTATRHHG